MFRAIPTNNKICFDKDLKRSWKIHADKVRNIRSTLKQVRPSQYAFLDQRPKKIALQEVRFMEIEKENNCLLERIKNINKNGAKRDSKSMENFERKKTLNQPFRKRELVKIVEENQELMKRIQSKKSMYNVRKWEKERKQVQKNITLLSEFKYKDYPNTQTKVNMWMTEEDFSKKSRVQNLSFQRSRVRPTLSYNGTKKIGENYYLIQAFACKKNFYIEMENLQNTQDKYRMEMLEQDAHNLLQSSFEGNLNNLVENLRISEEEGYCYLAHDEKK